MSPRIALPLSLAFAAALSACAADTEGYPSLAKRPAERESGVYGDPAAPATPAPLPEPSAAVLGELDSLLGQARAGDARFRRGEPTARRLVSQARGARIGTEGWSIATTAVSELEAARGQTMVPLAELDRLFADAMTRGEDVSRIVDARDQVIAIVNRQDEVLAALRGQLGS